jgi:hypothetical protein
MLPDMKTYSYRGYVIGPKQDFGTHGYLSNGKIIKKGWVVCYGPGARMDLRDAPNMLVEGCNAMPGATWFQTIKEAKHGIDVLIKVGGEQNSDKFWEIMHPFEYKHVGQKADFESGSVRKGRFAAIIENFKVVKLVNNLKGSAYNAY